MAAPRETARVHWFGGVRWPGGECLASWPCCCSGERALRLAYQPNQTRDVRLVTCGTCLRVMRRQPSLAAELAALGAAPALSEPA